MFDGLSFANIFLTARWKCLIATMLRKNKNNFSADSQLTLSVFTAHASFVRHSTKYRPQEIPYTYIVKSAFLSCDYLSNKRYKPTTFLKSD